MSSGPINWEDRQTGGSRFADGSAIIRPDELQWTAGPIEGAMFRLTHVDRSSGMWTAVVKVAANVALPKHFNHGEVQIYALEGVVAIDDVWLGAGDYFQDAGGQSRSVVAGPDGAVYFVMYSGGLSATGKDGEPEGAYIDANRIYGMAKANGAADHLGSLQLA